MGDTVAAGFPEDLVDWEARRPCELEEKRPQGLPWELPVEISPWKSSCLHPTERPLFLSVPLPSPGFLPPSRQKLLQLEFLL